MIAHATRTVVIVSLGLICFITAKPLRDFAEDRVHAVQVTGGRFAQDHEKLAPAGILAGVCHRQRADFVLAGVSRGLALDVPAGAAGADPPITCGQISGQRIAALHHEVGQDAVELHAIV